jgi:hypothetical protein
MMAGKAVEVALLKHGQVLFRSIQNNPAGWADMSFRIRSELVFREATIQLATGTLGRRTALRCKR